MAEKNIEEVKTKLITKLYRIRNKKSAYKTFNRFQKTNKRLVSLDKKYSALIKRSKSTLVIGKNPITEDLSLKELSKLSIEELKNL
jgi:hypothetical protein